MSEGERPDRASAFRAACLRRSARAADLGSRFPEARAALALVGELARFQAREDADVDSLKTLVLARGPEPLRDAARGLDRAGYSEAVEALCSGRDRASPRSFFARVLLQRETAVAESLSPLTGPRRPGLCERCGFPPQVGTLRPEGDGTALVLRCSLCLEDWRWPRGRCPRCGESDSARLPHASAPELAAFETLTCESCRLYLHCIRLDRAPGSEPDVDEIAAVALDLWAREQGFTKWIANLAGI